MVKTIAEEMRPITDSGYHRADVDDVIPIARTLRGFTIIDLQHAITGRSYFLEI
jgi:hypothetical protein